MDNASIKVHNFSRMAQAGYILDRLLHTINVRSEWEIKFVKLKELDEELRSFLQLALSEAVWPQRRGCGVVSTAVRYVTSKLIAA